MEKEIKILKRKIKFLEKKVKSSEIAFKGILKFLKCDNYLDFWRKRRLYFREIMKEAIIDILENTNSDEDLIKYRKKLKINNF